jgi:adenylate cyclase
MAIVGAGGDDDHAEATVKCGKDMLTQLSALNDRIQADGRAPFRIGIGMHTGPAVVGSIGCLERLQFTAIGNTVNIAARVEQLTKELGVSLLLTEATAACLPRSEKLLALELTEIRGLADRVPLYTTAERP